MIVMVKKKENIKARSPRNSSTTSKLGIRSDSEYHSEMTIFYTFKKRNKMKNSITKLFLIVPLLVAMSLAAVAQ